MTQTAEFEETPPQASGPRAMAREVISLLVGVDAFISYARADSDPYAVALASELAKSGFRVFIDHLGTPAGAKVPEPVLRIASRARMFILIASTAAARSTSIRDELAAFPAAIRPTVVIDVDEELANTILERATVGTKKVAESLQALTAGAPSEAVIKRVKDAASFSLSAKRQRRAIGIAAAVTVALLSIAGWQSKRVFDGASELADLNVRKEEATGEVSKLTRLQVEAGKQLETAKKQLQDSEAATQKARATGLIEEARALLPRTAHLAAARAFSSLAISEDKEARALIVQAAQKQPLWKHIPADATLRPASIFMGSPPRPSDPVAATGNIDTILLGKREQSVPATDRPGTLRLYAVASGEKKADLQLRRGERLNHAGSIVGDLMVLHQEQSKGIRVLEARSGKQVGSFPAASQWACSAGNEECVVAEPERVCYVSARGVACRDGKPPGALAMSRDGRAVGWLHRGQISVSSIGGEGSSLALQPVTEFETKCVALTRDQIILAESGQRLVWSCESDEKGRDVWASELGGLSPTIIKQLPSKAGDLEIMVSDDAEVVLVRPVHCLDGDCAPAVSRLKWRGNAPPQIVGSFSLKAALGGSELNLAMTAALSRDGEFALIASERTPVGRELGFSTTSLSKHVVHLWAFGSRKRDTWAVAGPIELQTQDAEIARVGISNDSRTFLAWSGAADQVLLFRLHTRHRFETKCKFEDNELDACTWRPDDLAARHFDFRRKRSWDLPQDSPLGRVDLAFVETSSGDTFGATTRGLLRFDEDMRVAKTLKTSSSVDQVRHHRRAAALVQGGKVALVRLPELETIAGIDTKRDLSKAYVGVTDLESKIVLTVATYESQGRAETWIFDTAAERLSKGPPVQYGAMRFSYWGALLAAQEVPKEPPAAPVPLFFDLLTGKAVPYKPGPLFKSLSSATVRKVFGAGDGYVALVHARNAKDQIGWLVIACRLQATCSDSSFIDFDGDIVSLVRDRNENPVAALIRGYDKGDVKVFSLETGEELWASSDPYQTEVPPRLSFDGTRVVAEEDSFRNAVAAELLGGGFRSLDEITAVTK